MDFLVLFLEQSLAFLPLVFGIYLSYSILKRTDLTADGSFVLGAAVTAKLILVKMPILIVIGAAALSGSFCGILTSIFQYRDKVPSLIAGIVVLFILQSFNLIFMGRPNINLLNQDSLFTNLGPLLSLVLAVAGIFILLILFLYSNKGLFLRAFGSNSELINRFGRSRELYRMLGFMVSNALIAISGSLTAQLNGYADVSMGTGVIISGLVAVLVGLQMQKYFIKLRHIILSDLLGVFAGTLIYFLVVFYLSSIGINPLYLKLVIGVTLGALLLVQHKKKSLIGVGL